MATQIFKNYKEFTNRKDKSINGVTQEFVDVHPNFEADNITNVGCFNCDRCDYCNYCDNCYNCNYSNYCDYCNDCNGCYHCYRHNGLSNGQGWQGNN